MPYKLIYTDTDGQVLTLMQMSDPIYDEILNTIHTSKDDSEVLTSVCDFFPAVIADAFRERYRLEKEN